MAHVPIRVVGFRGISSADTLMGHSMANVDIMPDDCMEVIRFELPDGFAVTTRFFNPQSSQMLNRSGLYDAQWQWSTHEHSENLPKGRVFRTKHSLVYWELAIINTIQDFISTGDDAFNQQFEKGLKFEDKGVRH